MLRLIPHGSLFYKKNPCVVNISLTVFYLLLDVGHNL